MPLVTFSNDSDAASAGPSQTSTTASDSASQSNAQWHSQRAARLHKLEAALDATIRRRHAEAESGRKRPSYEPDYGSMLDSESEDDGNRSSSSSDSLHSDNSSLFYSEGQPLLCTYQPQQYPMPVAATEAPGHGRSTNTAEEAVPAVTPKTPEQYLPWSRRIRDALRGLCVASCCPGSAF
ncbi:hypothetical protein COEREDRAFT_81059 [Coemansia reversa NRRL 1564]|uniref:Uncharacterized protein n=1 Tax=Coemansia reversa (strain ATCC 12441 / NRRL 1564) TaxID=763665 RepID=A0A2G5BCG6_COERN|nr:hypothetical protein COEREDRAFT_81059 [Coemansia reversa NRRL 1564]|eukprot:PIA16696.1 hypothetical protein COEREDRAFT_81059 [Coemansia reversa NRRL 1564]